MLTARLSDVWQIELFLSSLPQSQTSPSSLRGSAMSADWKDSWCFPVPCRSRNIARLTAWLGDVFRIQGISSVFLLSAGAETSPSSLPGLAMSGKLEKFLVFPLPGHRQAYCDTWQCLANWGYFPSSAGARTSPSSLPALAMSGELWDFLFSAVSRTSPSSLPGLAKSSKFWASFYLLAAARTSPSSLPALAMSGELEGFLLFPVLCRSLDIAQLTAWLGDVQMGGILCVFLIPDIAKLTT
jgi:hypothetical protein